MFGEFSDWLPGCTPLLFFLLDMSIAMVFLECELSKAFFFFFFLPFSLLISSEELAKL